MLATAASQGSKSLATPAGNTLKLDHNNFISYELMENAVAEIHRGQTENGEREAVHARNSTVQRVTADTGMNREHRRRQTLLWSLADITTLTNYQNFSIKSACDLGSTL